MKKDRALSPFTKKLCQADEKVACVIFWEYPVMSLPLFIVDAFTSRPFAGNPAAVCLLDAARDEGWMQALAGEMNLSETAYLLPEQDGYRLRWFTPRVEVKLCGHATLASAHVLWQTGKLPGDRPARFFTQSGVLTATREGDTIAMDFPAVRAEACADEVGLAAALGATVRYMGRNGMDYLVEVDGERAVRELRPDLGRLAELAVRGVIVTGASGTADFDFVSRFFAPRVGVPEDPVTGSAHCCLGPYWAEKLGKNDLRAYQASPRGGVVQVGVRGERVLLGGQAVTVVRGEVQG
jgi:PhzF family phenazine biosynthesis protein